LSSCKSTFFNSWVDVVPGVVEAFVGPREARLYRPSSFEEIMSGKKSVETKDEVTIYLDTEVYPPFNVVLR
jgi:hypothetical protein